MKKQDTLQRILAKTIQVQLKPFQCYGAAIHDQSIRSVSVFAILFVFSLPVSPNGGEIIVMTLLLWSK